MLLRPGADGVAAPDLAHLQRDLWFGPVRLGYQLLDALAAHAEHVSDLGRADEMMHGENHSLKTNSHLTSGQASRHTSHMTSAVPDAAHCLRCGRALRSPASVRASYGAWCRAKIRAAALAAAVADFTVAQVAKARELISDGGLVPTRRAGVFRAVSSDGQGSYLAHAATCNCPAGLRSRKACYHSLAVRIVCAGRAA